MQDKIVVAADGSSLGNPGPAGWCWFIDGEHWRAGGWESATNNQAELTAVLDLLQATAEGGQALEILCDSQYVIKCCTEWLPKWKNNGWRKADRKPVENQDLLRQLDASLTGRAVEFKWVKGHAGHDLNEAADERARAVATAYREGVAPDCGPGLGRLQSQPETVASQTEVTGVEVESTAAEKTLAGPAEETGEQIIETLIRLETELLSPSVRADVEQVRSYLHPEYIAHASNGQIWDLAAGLRAGTQMLGSVQVKALDMIQLGDGYLLRWASLIDGRKSTRVSLWIRGGSRGWQLRFTQATLCK